MPPAPPSSERPPATPGGRIGGIGAIIIFPLFYGIAGLIGGLIAAALYNLVAGLVGGVVMDLDV